jgi:hypothetical protein
LPPLYLGLFYIDRGRLPAAQGIPVGLIDTQEEMEFSLSDEKPVLRVSGIAWEVVTSTEPSAFRFRTDRSLDVLYASYEKPYVTEYIGNARKSTTSEL